MFFESAPSKVTCGHMRKLFSETEIGAFEQKFFSAELVDLRNCLDDNIALVKKIREDSY